MSRPDPVLARRLRNQQLSRPRFDRPEDVVSWLGAVQAQDFAGGKWAIALRLPGATDATVERAIADRKIIRTWPMRRTLHFVAAADIRWMLALLGPRMLSGVDARYRALGLDAATLTRSERALTAALRGGNRLARPEVMAVLARAGVDPGDQRGIHIICHLAQRAVLCHAPHIGKQAAFALLDDWVPAARELSREAALAELARRYFASHGPATARDFAWWAGLNLGDARTAVKLAGSALREDEDGSISGAAAAPAAAVAGAHLLPPWDEYIVAYKDRSLLLDARQRDRARSPDLLRPTVVVDGRVVGTWTRSLGAAAVVVRLAPFARLGAGTIRAAADRYGRFLGREVRLA